MRFMRFQKIFNSIIVLLIICTTFFGCATTNSPNPIGEFIEDHKVLASTVIGASTGAVVAAVRGSDSRRTWEKVGAGAAAGILAGTIWDQKSKAKQQMLALAEGQNGLQMQVHELQNVVNQQGQRLDAFQVQFAPGRDSMFAVNSEHLSPYAQQVFAETARTLVANPSLRVQVFGHTDSTGTNEYNQALSVRRAMAVAQFLQAYGVGPERIVTIQGYGETRPIANNSTPQGRAKNRRVEVNVIGGVSS